MLEAYYLPIDPEDLAQIVDLLRSHAVFAPSFVPTEDEDVYHPLTYRRQERHHSTPTTLLPDRNVFTRWLALVDQIQPSIQHRVSAAIMVFAQCSDILIEPNLALYEAAMTAGSKAANEELRRFRIAENLQPNCWADIALGRIENLVLSDNNLPAESESSPIDFEMPLRRWRRNYMILLKLAELDLKGADRATQITELIRWMYEDFIISGPALIFAIYYLAPHSQRRGLLKNLRSDNRERALNGIRNAAWDVTFLSDWISRTSKQKTESMLTVLCSLDRSLLRLANMLAPRRIDPNSPDSLRPSLLELLTPWGDKASGQLSETIDRFLSTKDNPKRQIHRPDEVNLDDMIATAEAVIRDWKPSRSE